MTDEPIRSFYPLVSQWRVEAVAHAGLQYQLTFETLDDGLQQVVVDAATFEDLLEQAMGLRNLTPEQKAEIILAANEGEDHDDD